MNILKHYKVTSLVTIIIHARVIMLPQPKAVIRVNKSYQETCQSTSSFLAAVIKGVCASFVKYSARTFYHRVAIFLKILLRAVV